MGVSAQRGKEMRGHSAQWLRGEEEPELHCQHHDEVAAKRVTEQPPPSLLLSTLSPMRRSIVIWSPSIMFTEPPLSTIMLHHVVITEPQMSFTAILNNATCVSDLLGGMLTVAADDSARSPSRKMRMNDSDYQQRVLHRRVVFGTR